MARDYVVNITGRDNLSATLKGVKQQLQDTTSSASGLDKIEQRFERIQNSTAPLKRKLRELQGIMDKMNLDGLANTDVFTRMAAEAASYKDAIGDTAQAVRLLSSDTATLDAGIEAFQGLAGAASIATGVMGMLGSENEDVEKAILKVQSAIGILNGVQAIANTLNKDSILMLKLKQFWESANAETTVVATTATTANTVVTNANRIATQAWNTVKAISKALLGDFTGLILVGAGALATYAMFTDDSTEADKKNADALKDQKSEAESLADTLSKKLGTETANLTGKYLALRDGWKNCRNEQEKNEFISNNATAFKSLGLNITDVSSAENAFVANTNSVVQALNARAEAAAYAAIQQELYEKAIRQEASVKQQKQKVTTNTRNINNQRARAVGNTKYHDTNNYTTARIQEQEAEARETRKQAEEMGRKSAEAARKATRLRKKSGAFGSGNKKTGGKATGTTGTTGTTNNNKKQPVFKEDAVTIEDMTNNVNILTSKLKKLDINTAEFEEVSKQLEGWKDKLSAVDEKLEIKPKFEEGSITGLTNQIQAIEKRLKDEVLTPAERQQLVTDREVKIRLRENLEVASGLKERKTEQPKTRSELYNELKGMAGDVQSDFDNGLIDKDEAIKRIADINAQIALLGGKPIKLEFQSNFDQVMEDFTAGINAINGIDGIVKSVQSLSQSLKEGADAWEIFMGAVGMASSVISAISAVMETYNILSSIHTAKKTAEGAATTAATTAVTAAESAKAAADTASIAPAMGATAAAKAQEAAYLDLAAAAYFAAHASIPFAGFGIAAGFISSMMAMMAAQTAASASIAAFADGGIIQGANTHGDQLLARVNAGEMILNGSQQRNLFNLLDGGTGSNMSGQVEFKISGSALKGVLRNYDNKMSVL